MGSGRKRPADHSPTPTRDSEGRKGETKKKKKKTSKPKENTTEQTHKSSLETTATAEGQKMAQVLSTFSRLEQSRFEAFRRATFCGDAIAKYVAHCLIEQHPDAKGRAPVLSEVCAEGQAEEITVVVSTLAKAYAQRLVTAARRLVDGSNQPIEPQHIIKAYEERRAQGLDPGFFLQPAESAATTVLKHESHDKRRLAALQAQEEYDKEHGINDDGDDDDDDDDDDDPMETSPTKINPQEDPVTPQKIQE